MPSWHKLTQVDKNAQENGKRISRDKFQDGSRKVKSAGSASSWADSGLGTVPRCCGWSGWTTWRNDKKGESLTILDSESRKKLCNRLQQHFKDFNVYWVYSVQQTRDSLIEDSLLVYSCLFGLFSGTLHITALNILNITLNRGDSRLSMALAVTWHIPCGSTTARWEQTRLPVQAVSETSFWKQCCQRKDFPSLQIMCLYRYIHNTYI